MRYGYRSFDRQWLFGDNRLIDRPGPPLWQAHGDRQVYLTSLLAGVLGLGPAATATAEVPDLHHFSGRGGKDVIPLWRDAAATEPNVTEGLLDLLSGTLDQPVSPEDLFAYAYAILASPAYVERFSEELTIPGPHLPLTRDPELFRRGAEIGRSLVHLHTYGERFGPGGARAAVPKGRARSIAAIPDTPDDYPERFSYDEPTRTLHVGGGEIGPVEPEVWRFSVSGLEVVRSWLGYRMRDAAGRASSPLDAIRPERWTWEMTIELLELLWVLEGTVERLPELEQLLDQIVQSDLFTAAELPQPTEDERRPPATAGEGPAMRQGEIPLE